MSKSISRSSGERSRSLNEKVSKPSKLKYLHDVDLLQNNTYAQQLNASVKRQLKFRSNTHLESGGRSLQFARQTQKTIPTPLNRLIKNIEYNKWYIEPKLRYLKKEDNPKNNIRAYENQEFIYKNLHNQYFWDWQHPFDKVSRNNHSELSTKAFTAEADDLVKNKGNIHILQEFRKKLQDTRARLPLIVKEVLESKE